MIVMTRRGSRKEIRCESFCQVVIMLDMRGQSCTSGGKRLFMYVCLEDDVATWKFGKASVKKLETVGMDGKNESGSDYHMRKTAAEEWVSGMSLHELSKVLVLVLILHKIAQ